MINLRLFQTETSYESEKPNLALPNVSLVEEDKAVKYKLYSPAPNEIWYTTIDNQVCTLTYIDTDGNEHVLSNSEAATYFGAPMVSNVYNNGKGVITFSAPITKIDTCTDWGNESLFGTNLNTIVLPEGIEIIGNAAFSYCINLEDIRIPHSVRTIFTYAFNNCGFETLTIPFGVTYLADGAITDCSNLKTIHLPGSLEHFENNGPVWDCENLEQFTGLSQFISPDKKSLIYEGKVLTLAPAGLTEYTIPDGVRSFGFIDNAANITGYTLPSSLRIFDECWQYSGYKLSLKYNGTCAQFEEVLTNTYNAGYDNLKNDLLIPYVECSDYNYSMVPDNQIWYTTNNDDIIDFSTIDAQTVFGANIASNYYDDLDINACVLEFGGNPTALTLNSGATWTNCTDIKLPETCKSIGELALMMTSTLESIQMPYSLNTLGKFAFMWSGLKSVNIPPCLRLPSVPQYCFQACASLSEVKLPNTILGIDDYAFMSCSSLEHFDMPTNLVVIGKNSFSSAGLKSIHIPQTVNKIDENAFQGCTQLENVTISDGGSGYIAFGTNAFFNCTKLSSITLPHNTEIRIITSYDVFKNCTSLPVIGNCRYADNILVEITNKTQTSYYIQPGTQYIWTTFAGCRGAKSIIVPNSVENITIGCFSGCTSLESMDLSNTQIEYITSSAFTNCTSLTSVIISNNIKSIEGYAFNNTPNLTGIYFKGTQAQWNAITKASYWMSDSGLAYVQCLDGKIVLVFDTLIYTTNNT